MRLISLSANKESFKTVYFNKSGASFILAKQDKPELQDNSKTYNGVGKSLLVALIDFCLGASTRNKITKSLQQKLPDWYFILEVEIKKQPYKIVRHTNTPKEISLGGEKLSLTDFCSKLESLCFDIPKDIQYLTYRSLLPFFLRPSKHSYLQYDEPIKYGKPYQKQLCNAFLLGLNVEFSQVKMQLKQELDETRTLHKNIKNDPILRQFFEGHKDASLALKDLNEKIEHLERDLQNFEVAEDYYQVKQEADDIKKRLDKIQNQLVLKSNVIDNINKSLEITPDIKRQDIQNIYDESKLIFKSTVEKRLRDLEKFYSDLTINRTKRLLHQKKIVNEEISQLQTQFAELKISLDQHLKFLNAHKALDVFTQMTNQLSDLQQQREKLQGYEKLQKDYENKKTALESEMLLQTVQTSEYLEQNQSVINNLMEYFRLLAKRFYSDALAGITIHNNDGKNQIRYNIDAKIESDTSDGINSIKLFCYDLTLLIQGVHHNMDFVFHDSRLYSHIDEAHSEVLFQIVKERFKDSNYQYIATLNQTQFNTLSLESKKFIEQHLILTLTDDADSGKLLGLTVDIEYD